MKSNGFTEFNTGGTR